jgi:hypothetical protein
MTRKIDPAVETIIKGYGLVAKDVLWDCHGTWCMYHRSIEKIAADQGIAFDPPQVLEANGAAKSVALCVVGRFKDRAEWSVGEASPANCKNAYPYAMAEKRAKDRVVLKLIGLHGLVYSEDEMPEEPAPAKRDPISTGVEKTSPEAEEIMSKIDLCANVKALDTYGGTISGDVAKLSERDAALVRARFGARKKFLKSQDQEAA